MEMEERMKRWCLMLGNDSQVRFQQMGGGQLDQKEAPVDQTLATIYDNTREGNFGQAGAGKGPSMPVISKWPGDIRSLFNKELVAIIQGDTMERCSLKQLMLELELLEQLEPDISLASMILTLKNQIPGRLEEQVRSFIRRIVEEISKLLAEGVRRSVTAAINKRRHFPIPSAAALDYKETIRRNLKNYDPQLKYLMPEHFYFFDRSTVSAANRYTVILDVDQSGSMGESVIYSSVISCILANMASVKTHIVAFDIQVADLTEKCSDPVNLPFGFQLGGGTDIEKSVAYYQQLMETPKKTLFFLTSDLVEGGDRAGLIRRLGGIRDSGASVICLLAIVDRGKPYYDAQVAGRIASMGIPCFACNPQKVPHLLEHALKGQDLTTFQKEPEKKER